MSTLKGIFEPFKEYVVKQLRLRKHIIKQKNVGFSALPQLFFSYTSKQCTIRMASGVDIRGNIKNPPELLNQEYAWESKMLGKKLAQNWVLEGGIQELDKAVQEPDEEAMNKQNEENQKQAKEYIWTLNAPFTTKNGKTFPAGHLVAVSSNENILNAQYRTEQENSLINAIIRNEIPSGGYGKSISLAEVDIVHSSKGIKALRGGIGQSGAYGDPKVRANFDNDYGLVPMPGIIDAEIRTKSDDGSLREAKVNFKCHNRKQLEILETLYMRPGYPILLEWGWNPYISNFKSVEEQDPILDEFFDENKTFTELNQLIIQKKENSGGNYDGFIGYCKNFSFKASGTGGFDCETEIMAQGEILESLKMPSIQIPSDNVVKGEYFEVEPSDIFLYLLTSIKKNLQKAGDTKFIQLEGSDSTKVGAWHRTWLFAKNGTIESIKQFFRPNKIEVMKDIALKTVAEAEAIEDQNVKEAVEKEEELNPIHNQYIEGFKKIIELIRNINKVTVEEIKKEAKVDGKSLDFGYDSFLYGTFLQEISMIQDKRLNVDGQEQELSGKDKSIYVRWDMICQIANYCMPHYKGGTQFGEQMVQLSYINDGQKIINMDRSPDDGLIIQGQDNTEHTSKESTGKYYIDYSLPGENRLHPALKKEEGLTNLLGQSYDSSVCIMPHQFDESLIVSKYDSKVNEKLKEDQEARIAEEEEQAEIDKLNAESGLSSPTSNIDAYKKTVDEQNKDIGDIKDKEKQNAQNLAENYRPLTSYEGVKFSNQSIGLVYFNLEHLIKRYRSMRLQEKENKDGKKVSRLNKEFSFMDFITKIWKDVNQACAGYYDFDLQLEHEQPHIAKIVDKTPSGIPPAKSNFFEFDPQGIESQVRDFNFSSKISSEIADVISIAAGSPNDAKSLEALSFKSFHKNIKNRFTEDKFDFASGTQDDKIKEQELRDELMEYEFKFLQLKKYQVRQNNQYKVTSEANEDREYEYLKGVENIDSATAISIATDLEKLMIKINSKFPLKTPDGARHPKAGHFNVEATHDRNAIIPLEFDLQMDGISGISPLNLFKINPDRLPYGYQREDIAFIVKGERQKITAGQDWVTELNGQMTLLNTNQIDEGYNTLYNEDEKIEDPPEKDDADEVDEDDDALINPTEDQDFNVVIASGFPKRNNGIDLHLGLDIAIVSGTPLVAVGDGTVEKRLNGGTGEGGFGQYIILTLDKKDEATGVEKVLYAHLKEVIKTGAVKKGDRIALSGGAIGDYGAGSSKGAHLHYEVGTMGAFTSDYFAKKRQARLDTGLVLNPMDTINYSNGVGNRQDLMPSKDNDTEEN